METWTTARKARAPLRRILDRTGGTGCAIDTGKALEKGAGEGLAKAVAKAGATVAASLGLWPAVLGLRQES